MRRPRSHNHARGFLWVSLIPFIDYFSIAIPSLQVEFDFSFFKPHFYELNLSSSDFKHICHFAK